MKIFLDTSVLLAAVLSSNGASAQIITLCEAGLLEGIISTEVLQKAITVIGRKFPEQKKSFEKMMGLALTVKKIPSRSQLWEKARSWIQDPNDVMSLVGVRHFEVDLLLTLDLRDFIKDVQVAKKSGLKISMPGDFLDEYYKRT